MAVQAEATLPAPVDDAPAVPSAERPPEEPVTTRVVIRRAPTAAWAVAAVFLGAIAAATFLIYTVMYSVPAKVIETGGAAATTAIEEMARVPDRLAAAFKPEVNVSTIVSSGIENVKHESKLVVLTTDVDVEIDKSSEKRVLWESFKLGDTTVRLRVRDNRVQYVIPLQAFDQDDVTFDPEDKSLCVTLPAPRVDPDVVEVQSNPDSIDTQTEVGWGRLQMFSGDFLLEEAKRELRDAVLREGANPILQDKARAAAERTVRELLKGWMPNLREDVELNIAFIDDEPEKSA
ncbi:MAG: DUF4230 domain-containing protein [Candidatus Hydrogenedentes bacterium]|nr:DUF4230 domain-containing protein [Candidatus Hydrogenedentota bacterium]